MLCFEMCPRCSQTHRLSYERMKPMILSDDETKMQCGVCGHSFKLPDGEAIIELAISRIYLRYNKEIRNA